MRGPKLRADERSAGLILARVTPQERELVRIAADVNRQTVSAFIRDAVLLAANDCMDIPPASSRGTQP